MAANCMITYLENSGFSVKVDGLELVFDCIDGYKSERGQPSIYFASHAHGDHFDRRILPLLEPGGCEIVLGYDIRAVSGCSTMRPGDEIDVLGAHIEAFGSTDAGVSFLVCLPGLTLFHAGDLNDWHWRSESTPDEAREAHENFMTILKGIPTSGIDVAFFPVDPRMGEGYHDGAIEFIAHAHPRLFIPMHWAGQPDVAYQFSKRHFDGTEIIALTESGQTAEYFNGGNAL